MTMRTARPSQPPVSNCDSKRDRNAFTLIELLVVVAIISLLVSILLPSLTKAKDLAKSALCATRLRQLGVGIQLYTEQCEGIYPPFYMTQPSSDFRLWQEYVVWALGERSVEDSREIFHCPSDPEDTFANPATDCGYWCSYGGNQHLGYIGAYQDKRLVTDVPDPSRVMLLVDTAFYGGWHCINVWANPCNPGSLDLWLGWRHPLDEAFNILFCDGHVENQRETLDNEQIVP